jgi:hypothetical protein
MATVEEVRLSDAKRLSAWYEGKADAHPHGLSGHQIILPRHLTSNCWDTAPRAYAYSEWGNACGIT